MSVVNRQLIYAEKTMMRSFCSLF